MLGLNPGSVTSCATVSQSLPFLSSVPYLLNENNNSMRAQGVVKITQATAGKALSAHAWSLKGSKFKKPVRKDPMLYNSIYISYPEQANL